MSAFASSARLAARFVAMQGGQFAAGAAQGAAGLGHVQTGPPNLANGAGVAAGQTARDRYTNQEALRRAAYDPRARHAARTIPAPAAASARTAAIGASPTARSSS